MKTFDDLVARGLVKQTTNTEKIRDMLNDGKITFYIGFDPTADSLHVGHLLQLVTAKRLMDAGHTGIMLVGGATALIGDPTGKTDMRKMLQRGDIRHNAAQIQKQIDKIVNSPNVRHTNNLEWFDDMKFLNILRDVGPFFSVNNMLRAECFKSRMEQGLSFLEFNYMILQAFDFMQLLEQESCVLQLGGDDQWSNMLAGKELIHKKLGFEASCMTFPLLVNSDGTKMGKTERGAVWLDSAKTSPFEFFQFWRNIPDDQVEKCIKFFTDESWSHMDGLSINEKKKVLATSVTTLVHGQDAAEQAREQAEALFEKKDASSMEAIEVEEGIKILDLLVQLKFAKSKTDARNLINNNGISIDDTVVTQPLLTITRMLGEEIVIRKGKKQFARISIKESNETRICHW